MNKAEILARITTLESRLDADVYVSGVGFAPATGSTREWLLSSIKTLKAELPRVEHDDLVNRFGFKFVEQSI
jgi:hypothetical protein